MLSNVFKYSWVLVSTLNLAACEYDGTPLPEMYTVDQVTQSRKISDGDRVAILGLLVEDIDGKYARLIAFDKMNRPVISDAEIQIILEPSDLVDVISKCGGDVVEATGILSFNNGSTSLNPDYIVREEDRKSWSTFRCFGANEL